MYLRAFKKIHRVQIPVVHPIKSLHSNHTSNTDTLTTQEWVNFILSATNCVIVSSILWGFESYKEKIKLIEDTNRKINDMMISYQLLEKQCRKYITKRQKNEPSDPPIIGVIHDT